MTRSRLRQVVPCALSLSVGLVLLAGCSAGTSTGTVTPPQQIVVIVSGAGTARLGATTQFSASVSGTTNTAVTWDVDGVPGGAAATGTISTAGLYTAPATLPASPYTETIAAVSHADSGASGSATESLENPLPVAASATATEVGATTTYTVAVTGSGFVPASAIEVGGVAAATTYVSSTQLQTTVVVAAGTTTLAVAVSNPDPGGSTSASANVTLPTTISLTEAARLLDQTSFGPTLAGITQVAQEGLDSYLKDQFSATPTLMPQIPTSPLPALCVSSTAYQCAESYFWNNAINGPDQLRQRVAFALSETFVVSTQTVPGQSIPSYYNDFVNDAFGNFLTVMTDVALSPAMGDYLNMLNSAKAGPGQIANENYPRESMQLFTIGVDLLNPDGTVQLDANGNTIQPYDEAQIQAFARTYTGWTFATASGGSPTKFPNPTANWADPMAAVESAHDTSSKILLNGTVLPAGQTAEQDLTDALNNVFNHPNVAPFVCKELIQHLVTSTPSPAYVARVGAVFDNDGTGVRGNLKAVIRAILTDPEARAGDTDPNYDGGHLREPVLFITDFYRGLGFTNNDTVNNSYFKLANSSATLSETPYRANSVFNFFPPDYVIPGGGSLNAPEFGIENTATTTLEMSLVDLAVNNKLSGFSVDLSNTSPLGVLAANPANLVNTLSVLFMHSQMPAAMQTAIINAITPLKTNAQRARVAVYLVLTSSDYKIIH